VFRQGAQVPAPLIIGSNSNEATVAQAFGVDPAKVVERLGAARVLLRILYPGVDGDEQLGREVVRDLVFTTFARRIAYLHSAKAPTWRYYFSYVPQDRRAQEPGVPHGGELPFVFGTGTRSPGSPKIEYRSAQREGEPYTKPPWTEADETMARTVGDYWFAFARSGVPGSADAVEWEPDGRWRNRTLEFGDQITVQDNFMEARINTFIGVLDILELVK
jgi:para-nitrobenzyl esterase